MEIIDRFSKTLGLSNQDDAKEAEPTEKEEVHEPQPVQPEQNDQPPIQPPRSSNTAGRNVIDFNSAARDALIMNNNNNNNKPMIKSKITTVKPKTFDEDAKVIADCLRENIPVIINLEETSPEHARRLIDFALGTTYAIEGDVQQVSELVFVCTPKTVMVTFNKEEPKQQPENDFSWLTRRI
ncbi:MAG: cell division protein SepF [Selenomonadaceae bacterium]|nr:cell division protein SepF [Selenomonadaceae bacterium]